MSWSNYEPTSCATSSAFSVDYMLRVSEPCFSVFDDDAHGQLSYSIPWDCIHRVCIYLLKCNAHLKKEFSENSTHVTHDSGAHHPLKGSPWYVYFGQRQPNYVWRMWRFSGSYPKLSPVATFSRRNLLSDPPGVENAYNMYALPYVV